MGAALRFRQTQPIPRQPGEHARIKVVQGPDSGAIYILTGPRASIGRGDDNEVILGDLKASRRHAEIFLDSSGKWNIKDKGSANGIIHRGEEKREAVLQSVDQISLGETTFEFVDARAGDAQIVAAPKLPIDVARAQLALDQQKERVRAIGRQPKAGSITPAMRPKPASSSGGKNSVTRIILIAGIALLGYSYMLPSNDSKKTAAAQPAAAEITTPNRDLASYMGSIQETPEVAKQSEMFFKAGFREFREQNYLRARTNFENVLQLSPGHAMARIYLTKSIFAINEQVEGHLVQGKKSLDAGKLKDARAHYEAVMRLLFRDPSNPKYDEARNQLDKVKLAEHHGIGGTS